MKLQTIAAIAFLGLTTLLSGCKKEPPAAPAAGDPKADQVAWDPKTTPNDAPEWPMKTESLVAASATSFAKTTGGQAGPNAPSELWGRLKPFAGSYLKSWRTQLSGDPSSATDVVDAFLELALQVTGPTGFWRKTVAGDWLGCAQNGETPPCEKLAAMNDELAQWDGIMKQISDLDPSKSQKFVQKNLGRMLVYLDTYVPEDSTSPAMKKTPFYQKHLASVLDGML